MKGQALNVDWVVGMSVFIVALAGSTLTLIQTQDLTVDEGFRSKAELLVSDLQEDSTMEASFTPLYVRQPHSTGKLPVDTSYQFDDPTSVHLDTVSRTEVAGSNVVAVVSSGNNSYRMASFSSKITHSYSDSVETDTDNNVMENDNITINLANGGIDDLSLNSRSYLYGFTDLGEGNVLIKDKGVYASAWSRLKIYNGSNELVLEDPDLTFNFNNFSQLYWAPDGSTLETNGEGVVYREGITKGLSLTNMSDDSHTVTLTGNMTAKVFRGDGETDQVKVEVRKSNRTRIRLHKEGIERGKKRIENYRDGYMSFGAEEELTTSTDSLQQDIKSMDELDFESQYGLSGFNYNISGAYERGKDIPLKQVATESRSMPNSSWNGSLNWTEVEVAVWQ